MTEPAAENAPDLAGSPEPTTSSVVNKASAERVDSLADTLDLDWRQDISLKRDYATWSLRITAAQLVLVDVVFIIYATARDFDIPEAVISAWLGATVVQVVAVTLAVTRGLFRPPPG